MLASTWLGCDGDRALVPCIHVYCILSTDSTIFIALYVYSYTSTLYTCVYTIHVYTQNTGDILLCCTNTVCCSYHTSLGTLWSLTGKIRGRGRKRGQGRECMFVLYRSYLSCGIHKVGGEVRVAARLSDAGQIYCKVYITVYVCELAYT